MASATIARTAGKSATIARAYWQKAHYGNLVRGTANLLAYYPLDESSGPSLDVVGGVNGSKVGGVTQNSEGRFRPSRCAQFDGSTGEFDLPSTFGLTNRNVTFEAIVYIPTLPNKGFFLASGVKEASGDGYGFGLGASVAYTAGNHWIILYEQVRWIDTGVNATTGWHHVVFLIDNTTGRPYLFVDGTQIFTDAGSGPRGPTGGVSYIGGETSTFYGENRHFNGRVESAAFYNRALTTPEIQKHNAAIAVTLTYATGTITRKAGVTSTIARKIGPTATVTRTAGKSATIAKASSRPYRDLILATANLVGYWPLNEASNPVHDITDGSASIVHTPTPTTGLIDGARLFDETLSQYIFTNIDDPYDPHFSDFSFEAWIYLNSVFAIGQNHALWSKGGGGSLGYMLAVRQAGELYFSMQPLTDPQVVAQPSVGTISAGVWHHLVWTFDRDALARVFYDGVEVGGGTSIAGSPGDLNGAAAHIGRYAHSGVWHWNHKMAEVALYFRALTPAEILAHYRAGLVGV